MQNRSKRPDQYRGYPTNATAFSFIGSYTRVLTLPMASTAGTLGLGILGWTVTGSGATAGLDADLGLSMRAGLTGSTNRHYQWRIIRRGMRNTKHEQAVPRLRYWLEM